MAMTSRELLTQILEDLLEVEFKRFKRKLQETQSSDSKKHIPLSLLEKADPLSTADLLLDYFGEGEATRTTSVVLQLINKRELASDLERKLQASVRRDFTTRSQDSGADCQVLYKAAIRQKFSKVKDYNSLPGEWVDLEQRYIRLLIIKKHCNTTQREQAILSRGNTHLEVLKGFQDGGAARVHLETILDKIQNGQNPLTLILQGAAGIGKSYTLSKMMLDWACGRLYPEKFDYVFHLSLKELSIEKRPVSLEDLILANFKGLQPPLQQILSRPEKILFLMDGFDEVRHLYGQAEEIVSANTRTPYPAPVTVALLLTRQLLPECSLLITTRPSALEKLEVYLSADCYLEVLGFLEEERRAFFYSYFQDNHLAFEAYQAIQENDTISTMCFVPMVCWIVCTVLKKQMEMGHGLVNIQTTTHIFLHFTQIMLRHHHSGLPRGSAERTSMQDLLEKVGSLALSGILRQQVIFEAGDLVTHDLEASEIPSTFLNALLRQTVTVEAVYSFGHVTLQEFFAALFYFFSSQKEGWDKDISNLLEEGLKAENGHLILTIRFLFGLSNHQSWQMLSQLTQDKSPSSRYVPSILHASLLSWIQRAARSPRLSDPNFHLELLHCLYEAHQEDLVRQAMAELDNIRFMVFPLKRNDCMALAYCMQCCNTVQNLYLFCCRLGAEEVKLLQPALKKCQVLELEFSDLPDAARKDVSSSLSDRQTMTSLLLTSLINPAGVKESVFRCKAIEGPGECSLVIRYVLSDETVQFCSWAIPQHHPTTITLLNTQLSDGGLQRICSALRSAKNHLQTLRVSGNSLSKVCIPDLSSMVARNPLLTYLDLGSNNLGDEAVTLLCSELQVVASQLQYLKMDANHLTDACTASLARSLLPNQTLELLLLTRNALTSQSLPHLDTIWRECNSIKVINVTNNNISKLDRKRYYMFYNPKDKKSSEQKENS
ncbi:NACHT, LRR and PYD domains-containing protein 3-like isoform X2 [Lissotriton helveticus]